MGRFFYQHPRSNGFAIRWSKFAPRSLHVRSTFAPRSLHVRSTFAPRSLQRICNPLVKVCQRIANPLERKILLMQICNLHPSTSPHPSTAGSAFFKVSSPPIPSFSCFSLLNTS